MDGLTVIEADVLWRIIGNNQERQRRERRVPEPDYPVAEALVKRGLLLRSDREGYYVWDLPPRKLRITRARCMAVLHLNPLEKVLANVEQT